MTRLAEGEDAEIYVDFGGFAFQPARTSFIALYMMEGHLNTTDNDFFIGAGGGGRFTFVSNEDFILRFLKSVSANIEGDRGNPVRSIKATATGLSAPYPIDVGDKVTITWAPVLEYPFALPVVSFWGFIGGSIIGAISIGGAIKKRSLTLMWLAIAAGITALVCFIIFMNLPG